MVAQLPIKYCKTLLASGSTFMTPSQATRFFHKLLYEWWGFCVNGGTSLTNAGGLVAVNMPAGFQSGSLLASGNDGVTSFAADTFFSRSANFLAINSGSLIGKYLVTWIPGSSDTAATDDGVYLIKAIEDAERIRVDVHSGATRRLGNHPWFWDRKGINWRIVDIMATTGVTGSGVSGSWEGSYQVIQFNGAATVNVGQANSQLQVLAHANTASLDGNIGLVVSPGGTWNGSAFTDGTPEVTASFFNFQGASIGLSTYTLIGGQDFIISEVRGPNPQGSFSAGCGFHVEIPQRLYAQASDPNPIAWLLWQNSTPSQVAASYYNGFNMVGNDTNVHKWTTLVKSPMGTKVRADYTGNAYGTGQWQQFQLPNSRFGMVAFDAIGDETLHRDRYMTSDGVLMLSTPGQFSLARARLRHVRFTTATLPTGARIGDPITDRGGWIVVSNGVLWPWDDSVLPFGPWWEGV